MYRKYTENTHKPNERLIHGHHEIYGRKIFGMPYHIALSSLRPSIALNPKSIAFISVIFVLFDFFFGGGAC